MENPKTDPHKYSQFFTKAPRQVNTERSVFSIQGAATIEYPYEKTTTTKTTEPQTTSLLIQEELKLEGFVWGQQGHIQDLLVR